MCVYSNVVRLFAVLLLSCCYTVAVAQKIVKVHGEYVYRGPGNVSLTEARRIALERAKIQALADKFGTVVSRTNATTVTNREGRSSVDFMTIGASEVRGEWIETIGEPVYTDPFYEQGMLVFKVEVEGRAREIKGAGVDCEVRLLRNGTEPRFESETFRSGDDLYLYFKSPADGFLTVYLHDEALGRVYCLLPYKASSSATYPIEHDRPYVFFSAKAATAEERAVVDEYTMTCSRSTEHNTVYVVFSPNMFAKANSTVSAELLPRELSFKDFQEWLAECRTHDVGMEVWTKRIVVSKNF